MAPIKFSPIPAPLTVNEEGAVIQTAKDKGLPCRRCLRDSEPGDEMILLSYDPFLGTSPYSGPGPIYVHRKQCELYQDDGSIPEQQRRRLLALRGYDENHMMVDYAVLEGKELEELALKFFRNEAVTYVHVHNAGPGCFAVRLDRGAWA